MTYRYLYGLAGGFFALASIYVVGSLWLLFRGASSSGASFSMLGIAWCGIASVAFHSAHILKVIDKRLALLEARQPGRDAIVD